MVKAIRFELNETGGPYAIHASLRGGAVSRLANCRLAPSRRLEAGNESQNKNPQCYQYTNASSSQISTKGEPPLEMVWACAMTSFPASDSMLVWRSFMEEK